MLPPPHVDLPFRVGSADTNCPMDLRQTLGYIVSTHYCPALSAAIYLEIPAVKAEVLLWLHQRYRFRRRLATWVSGYFDWPRGGGELTGVVRGAIFFPEHKWGGGVRREKLMSSSCSASHFCSGKNTAGLQACETIQKCRHSGLNYYEICV